MLERLSLVPIAAALCLALPSWGDELPEGKGKELVAASCNSDGRAAGSSMPAVLWSPKWRRRGVGVTSARRPIV